MNILLLYSSLRAPNNGLNALSRGAISVLGQRYDDITFDILFSSNKPSSEHNVTLSNGRVVTVHEYALSRRLQLMILLHVFTLGLYKPRNPFFRQSFDVWKRADLLLDFTGGDSFTDIYGTRRFFWVSLMKLESMWAGKKLILMPQTLGPFQRGWTRAVAGFIVRKVRFAFFRDRESYQMATGQFSAKQDKCGCVMDMGFYMQPSREPEVLDYAGSFREGGRTVVGLNVSGLLTSGGYTRNNMFGLKADYQELMQTIADYFLRERDDVNLVLIPHVMSKEPKIEDDLVACVKLAEQYAEQFPERFFIADRFPREDRLKRIIGSCDYFIGSRMHACIAAISCGVPTTPVAYSKKFVGVWSMMGIPDCICDPRTEDIDAIMAKIKDQFEHRTESTPVIRDDSAELYTVIDSLR